MADLSESPSIVLVGGWNPSILQPSWFAKHLFGIEPPNEIGVLMEVSPIPGLPPRFTLEGLTFVPSYEKLIITVEQVTEESAQLIEEKTKIILNTLSHTPMRAMGLNFKYTEEAPGEELRNVFKINDPIDERIGEMFEELISTKVTSSIKTGNYILNLGRTFSSNGQARIDFNFHADVSSSEDAAKNLNDQFYKNYQLTRNIVQSYQD